MPTKLFRILTVCYLAVSSLVTLTILVNAFDSSGEKYLPAMMIANKFAFPIIISALALFFLVFFEPDAMKKKNVIVVFRILFFLTLSIFSYYVFLQTSSNVFSLSLFLMFCEEVFLLLATINLFIIHNSYLPL